MIFARKKALDDSVLIGVDGDEINKMATLICDGIK